jgi:hypothetical protein
MTTTLRVTEVYPEITVADAHPERSQTQEVGHNRTAASKTQPEVAGAGAELKSTAEEQLDTEDGGVKDTAGENRGGAKEHSREALRERVTESERPKAKNEY